MRFHPGGYYERICTFCKTEYELDELPSLTEGGAIGMYLRRMVLLGTFSFALSRAASA